MKRISLILFSVFLFSILTGCTTADFNQPTNSAALEKALSDQGIQVCSQADIPQAESLGVVGGKFYSLGKDCSQLNPNKPGALLWAVQFSSLEARNAAFRRTTSEWKRGLGHSFVWTAGPYLIVIDGPRLTKVEAGIKQALTQLGAR